MPHQPSPMGHELYLEKEGGIKLYMQAVSDVCVSRPTPFSRKERNEGKGEWKKF